MTTSHTSLKSLELLADGHVGKVLIRSCFSLIASHLNELREADATIQFLRTVGTNILSFRQLSAIIDLPYPCLAPVASLRSV